MSARLYTAILLVGLALAFTTGYSLSSWQARRDAGWQTLSVPGALPVRDVAPPALAAAPSAPVVPAAKPTPTAAPASETAPSEEAAPKHARAAKKTPHVVSPNHASVTDLQCLPGIGPVIAERIVAYRQEHGAFAAAEDLRRVKGIGPKILEKIRPFLRFP